jgi:hypothetical protein
MNRVNHKKIGQLHQLYAEQAQGKSSESRVNPDCIGKIRACLVLFKAGATF